MSTNPDRTRVATDTALLTVHVPGFAALHPIGVRQPDGSTEWTGVLHHWRRDVHVTWFRFDGHLGATCTWRHGKHAARLVTMRVAHEPTRYIDDIRALALLLRPHLEEATRAH